MLFDLGFDDELIDGMADMAPALLLLAWSADEEDED